MPILDNTFTVGTELQSLLISVNLNPAATYQAVEIGHLKHFSATQQQTPLTVIPITGGGLPIERNLYHGWHGRLSFARFSGAITALALGSMANFQNNGRESYITMTAVVNNTMSGSLDTYTFNYTVFGDIGFGDFDAVKEVDQEITFRSQSVTLIGSSSGEYATIANLPPVLVNLSPYG